MTTPLRSSETPDLGLETVESIHTGMLVDEPWTMREGRGFTWWASWIRQRVWSEEPTRDGATTLWHVRARTPLFAGFADDDAAYEEVASLNALLPFSSFVFDPADGTISARCGAFIHPEVAPWLGRWLLGAAGHQISLAVLAAESESAAGNARDERPHPVVGPRRDPDDMLNVLLAPPPSWATPIRDGRLELLSAELRAEGLETRVDRANHALSVRVPNPDIDAIWGMRTEEERFGLAGVGLRLLLREPVGSRRGRWIANALNAAESADRQGDGREGEVRPHALGTWRCVRGVLRHELFLPGPMVGQLDDESIRNLVRSLLAWGFVRTEFALDRLPWLRAAAIARYPDAGPDEIDDAVETEAEREEGAGDGEEAPTVPFAERSLGPNARARRGREAPLDLVELAARPVRELRVDPSAPDAYREIDDAVAVAEDGDRILVAPGTYRKPVVVDRAVEIVGDGHRADIVLEPAGGECLGFAASGAVVRGLTVRPARVGNDGGAASAVIVLDVEATVVDCLLSSHQGATVWVGGPSSRAVIRDCEIVDGAQNPVWVLEGGHAEMHGCRMARHRWPATVSGAHASLRIVDSEVVDGLGDGIAGVDGALLVVERTTVARNAGTGILLGESAPASRVEDCDIEDNLAHGLTVAATPASVRRNRIGGNRVGIVVIDGRPTLERNELRADVYGIGVRGRLADPRVVENVIAEPRDRGIHVGDLATGRFERNTITGAGAHGIVLNELARSPRFTGNVVSGSGMSAVLVVDGASAEFEGNDLRGNRGGSWELGGAGTLTRSGDLEDVSEAPLGPPTTPASGFAPGRVN